MLHERKMMNTQKPSRKTRLFNYRMSRTFMLGLFVFIVTGLFVMIQSSALSYSGGDDTNALPVRPTLVPTEGPTSKKLSLYLTSSYQYVTPGNTVAFTFVLHNPGDHNARNVKLIMPVPTDFSLYSVDVSDPNAEFTHSTDNSLAKIDVGGMKPGETIVATVYLNISGYGSIGRKVSLYGYTTFRADQRYKMQMSNSVPLFIDDLVGSAGFRNK